MITPVVPPIMNNTKKYITKIIGIEVNILYTTLWLTFEITVMNQLNILQPVGKLMTIVIAEKYPLVSLSSPTIYM
jgi:hypothetical protein